MVAKPLETRSYEREDDEIVPLVVTREKKLPLHKEEVFQEYDETLFSRKRILSDDSGPSLPSWIPANQNDESLFHNTLVFTAKRKSKFSFAVMCLCLLGFCFYSSARFSLKTALAEVGELTAFSEKLHRQVRSAERDVQLLERELAALNAMEQQKQEAERRRPNQASASASQKPIQEMNAIRRKLKYSAKKAEKLKNQVRASGLRDASAKYGTGIQQVEIELVFLDDTDGPTTFIIEMAPIELMPHSVYTFLEMVSANLVNGCSFIVNALHVLKAAPLPYDGTSAAAKARDFQESGLESVAFREYSPDYPHTLYTVGFAADGSPSFYINTEDNTEIHNGDPCFARVISGFDTIKRMEASPTRNGLWLERRIGIKRATIL